MKKGILVLLFCLLLSACSMPPPAPTPVPLAEETTAPPALTETEKLPHEHSYDAETGLCRTCGSPCPHGEGFSSEGRCLLCGWRCDHAQHDAESACCLRCGAQLWHHFGIAGRCEGCGREAPLAGERLPDAYYEPAEHAGQCLLETVTDAEGKEHSIALWLPWDYSEDGRYNVLILIHGDNGSCRDWTDREQPTARGAVQLCHVYDHMAEEHLCQPFLVVGIGVEDVANPAKGERFLKETLLPYLARSCATWMEGDSPEQIRAAREHIAIGGLSRGAMLTYRVGLCRCLDVAANFCCFSNADKAGLPDALEGEENRNLPIRSYVATLGLQDLPDYARGQRALYELLCSRVERIRDGENARLLEIDEGHNFLMWSASIYDALLLMF